MNNEEFAKILSEQSNCQTCRAKLFCSMYKENKLIGCKDVFVAWLVNGRCANCKYRIPRTGADQCDVNRFVVKGTDACPRWERL
jgi:predicted  nucleic acid-binding Zn-ribbon protein